MSYEHITPRELRTLRQNTERPRQLHALTECMQVERDNLDLHQALAEALRRLAPFTMHVGTDDLFAVLDRTARPAQDEQAARGGWAT